MNAENQPPGKDTFACRNGDRLFDLNCQKADAQGRLNLRIKELERAEELLKPLRESVELARSDVSNLSCRLNIWWNEFHARGGKETN